WSHVSGLVELIQCRFSHSGRNPDKTSKRLLHLDDQKYPAGARKRTDRQCDHHVAIAGRKDAKASKDRCEPERQNNDKGERNTGTRIQEAQPPRLCNVLGDLEGGPSEPALRIVLWGEIE